MRHEAARQGVAAQQQKGRTEKKKVQQSSILSARNLSSPPVRGQTDAETDLASPPMLPCLMVP